MKITVTENMFVNALLADEYANWSLNGARALFDYLEDADVDGNMEFDQVAIRCDFSEYKSAKEAYAEYNNDDVSEEDARDWLNGETLVIDFEGGIILQQF